MGVLNCWLQCREQQARMNSLFDHVDANYIASAVALHRGANKTCLMLEGKTDENVFQHFIDTTVCEIVICYSKVTLIDAVVKLNTNPNVDGYVAIKDADFDMIEGYSDIPNVILTDYHDLEVMLFESPAFDKVIRTKLIDENIEGTKIDPAVQSVRSHILLVAHTLGYFRLVAERNRWGIRPDFQPIIGQHATPENRFRVTVKHIVDHLRGEHPAVDESLFSEEELEILRNEYRLHLCRGHDLEVILQIALSKILEATLDKRIIIKDFTLQVINSYNVEMFVKTDVYARLCDWESSNKPLVVLKTTVHKIAEIFQ